MCNQQRKLIKQKRKRLLAAHENAQKYRSSQKTQISEYETTQTEEIKL